MKINRNKIKFLILICFIIGKISSLKLFEEKSENYFTSSQEYTLDNFEKEAIAKENAFTGITCTETINCRNQKEVQAIAYQKTSKLKNSLAMNKIFIKEVTPNYSVNGITRYVMTAPEMPGLEIANIKGSPMYKYIKYNNRICIPTSKSKKSYVDFHCPLEACAETYEESVKCGDSVKIAAFT